MTKKLAINGGPKAAETLKVPQWPMIHEEDKQAVIDALDSGHWCRLYAGSRVEQFEREFAQYHEAKHAIAVSNGTLALELAMLACGIGPGDEVLVPAVTFIATASAVVTSAGAVPVFVDIDPETGCISPEGIEQAISSRTKGVVAVHLGGYPADFDSILPIVSRHNLVFIEDASHAHGTEWKGRKIGTFGDVGTFSFQESKSVTAGEGGIITTNDDDIAERALLIHNVGRAVGKPGYVHYVLASNYRMLEIQAALLSSKLGRYQREQVERKHRNGEILAQGLREIGGLEPQRQDERITQHGYYLFVTRYDSEQFGGLHRDRFADALRAEGVPCGNYGIPLYKQPAFKREKLAALLPESSKPWPDYENTVLPAAERFCAEEQILFPHQVLLSDPAQLEIMLDAVAKIKENVGELLAAQ